MDHGRRRARHHHHDPRKPTPMQAAFLAALKRRTAEDRPSKIITIPTGLVDVAELARVLRALEAGKQGGDGK
jgi:hypothetical protein